MRKPTDRGRGLSETPLDASPGQAKEKSHRDSFGRIEGLNRFLRGIVSLK